MFLLSTQLANEPSGKTANDENEPVLCGIFNVLTFKILKIF